MFCFENRESKILKQLRKTQATLSEKRALVNELRCPTYDGHCPSEIEDFGRYFAGLLNGMISPQEFAARCINRRWNSEELFEYLNTLGQYLIVLSDYELQSTKILTEITALERVEQNLKRTLEIR